MNQRANWDLRWDYYSVQESPQAGLFEALNEQNALFKTSHLIETRRWIRIRTLGNPVNFLLIARVLRKEEHLSASTPGLLTRYRYLLEFTHTLSDEVLHEAHSRGLYQSQLNEPPRCTQCGRENATIPVLDLVHPEKKSGDSLRRENPAHLLCLQCHLRRSASRYLNPATLTSPQRELQFTSLS